MPLLKSRRLQLLIGVALLLFAVQVLFRLIFYFGFSELPRQDEFGAGTLWTAWSIGLRFDARLAILLTMPLLLLMLPRWNLLTLRWMRPVAVAYVVAATLLLSLFCVFDLGHYAYLGIRMDSTVIRFFDDVAISAVMVWESYPVIWITLGVAALTWLAYRLVRWIIESGIKHPSQGLSKKQMFGRAFAVFFASLWICMGRFSDVPLRWNNAFFAADARVGALALNPVLYFWETREFGESHYDADKTREYYDAVAAYLGMDEEEKDAERLNFRRRVPADPQAPLAGFERPPNVIFVMLESLGASRVSAYGNPIKTTPVLDNIAENGWFFRNFYVPVSGTAKTVWASITGLPDVSTVKTATRNPLIVEQRTIINAFKEHDKYYFLGGSAGWANMRALVKASINDVKLYEEGSYTEPRVDVWGISDLSLFRETDRVLRDIPKDQPFFAIVQTAANHRPFTIPDDHGDFEVDNSHDEQTLYNAGFKNPEQYNAVRFLDYNIGEFFNMAKAGGYFDNTLFVFYGDHNNRITITPFMDAFYEELDLDGLHVPHMYYAPKLLPPRVIEDATSLVDVLPTVAGLFGIPYENTGLGRDLRKHSGDERYVFTQTADKRHPVTGMISKDWMLRRHASGKAKLHWLAEPERDFSGQHPEKAARLKHLTEGMYEAARYLHYHNSPEKPES